MVRSRRQGSVDGSEEGLGQFDFERHRPGLGPPAPQFHSVFFGTNNLFASQKWRKVATEIIVVGEGVALREREPLRTQGLEKALGVGNPRDGDERLGAQGGEGAPLALGVDGRVGEAAVDGHALLQRGKIQTRGADDEHGHVTCGARPGFAQRPSRQQASIAQAPGIEDADLEVAAQPQVLEPVVRDDHLGLRVFLPQRLCRSQPIGADEDRQTRAPVQQQGLVTHLSRVAGGGDFLDLNPAPTVASEMSPTE